MIEDKDLESFLEALKECVTIHKGRVYSKVWGIDFIAVPSYTEYKYLSRSAFHYPQDRRFNRQIEWFYNPRQLTYSYAVLLHELGHFVLRHDLSDDNMVSELSDEIEAWEWAMSKWHLVPLRTRFPQYLMEMLLHTYFRNNDVFVEEDFIELEEIFYGEEKELRNYNADEEAFKRCYLA